MLIPIIFTTLACLSSFTFAAEKGALLTVKSADKTSAISLQLADDWKTGENKDGSISIIAPRSGVNIEVWSLIESTMDKAAANVADLIKTHVTDFKPNQTTPIEISGFKGKKISGPGVEADDGDPSTAEVYLFSVADKLYIICAHAEGDVAEKGAKVLNVLLGAIKKADS